LFKKNALKKQDPAAFGIAEAPFLVKIMEFVLLLISADGVGSAHPSLDARCLN
jgi:hypothetical protein